MNKNDDFDLFKKDHPNTPLNEFVEEDVDVTVINPVVDEKNKRVSFKTDVEKAKQKVYYAHSIPRTVVCGEHFFIPEDPKKYIFRCKNCTFHYKAQVITHKYNPDTGEIVYRHSELKAV